MAHKSLEFRNAARQATPDGAVLLNRHNHESVWGDRAREDRHGPRGKSPDQRPGFGRPAPRPDPCRGTGLSSLVNRRSKGYLDYSVFPLEAVVSLLPEDMRVFPNYVSLKHERCVEGSQDPKAALV
jgi:hypothetical protein